MTTPELCGTEFMAPSWDVHREVLGRLWDGDPVALEYQSIARELLGREQLPNGSPDELYLAFGRRSGKTRFEAVAGVHAWADDYRERGLAVGEWCHCVDKRQARTRFEYRKGLIEASRVVARVA